MNNKVEIFIDERRDYVSNYNTNMLNPELKDYILEELRGSNLKKGIKIEIVGDYFDSEEKKQEFLKLFKNEFSLSIKDMTMYLKYSLIASLLLGLLGIIFIVLSNVITASVFKEIFLIMGWLDIWESTANIIFNESKNYLIIKRYERIRKAKIIF